MSRFVNLLSKGSKSACSLARSSMNKSSTSILFNNQLRLISIKPAEKSSVPTETVKPSWEQNDRYVSNNYFLAPIYN